MNEASASSTASNNNNNSAQSQSSNKAKELIENYFHQLTIGCEQSECDNVNCAKNRNFKRLSNNDAAARALELARQKAPLCKKLSTNKKMRKSDSTTATANADDVDMSEDNDVATNAQQQHTESMQTDNDDKPSGESKSLNDQLQDCIKFLSKSTTDTNETTSVQQSHNDHPTGTFLTEEKLKILIETSKQVNNYERLFYALEKTFENFNLLSISFNLKQSSASSVTQDADLVDINLDLDSLKRSVHLLYQTINNDDNELDDCLNKNVNNLLNLVNFILTNKKAYGVASDDMAEINNILHIMLILNELPLIDNTKYLGSTTKLFYKTFGDLPDFASAKVVRLWSKMNADDLKSLVYRTQQFITLSIMNYMTDYFNNENIFTSNELNDISTMASHSTLLKHTGIQGACCYLRFLYYASILGGHLDNKDLIRKERAEEQEDIRFFKEQNQQQTTENDPLNEAGTREYDTFEELFNVRALDCRKPKVEFELFINELANKFIHIQHDYIEYVQQQQALSKFVASHNQASTASHGSQPSVAQILAYSNLTHIRNKNFSFLSFRFFLTLSKKNLGLYYDNKIRMIRERRNNMVLSALEGVLPMPYIKIRIKRDNVLAETLNLLELQEEESVSNIRKQLFVEFENEQGIDEGGVSKEFFQLAIDELLNKGYTFFTFDEKTRYHWFNPCTLESAKEFKLLGILFGMAIYNNVLLDLQFPPVFFRKLMGKIATYEDLKESHTQMYQSMQSILEYNGDDFEDVFMLTHQISFNDTFGSVVNFNIIENGNEIPVTKQNRHTFVQLYTDFILNTSIQDKFIAFRRGFMSVYRDSPLLKWYLPEELETLLCGSKVLDWKSLASSTNYDGGFTSDHEFIKIFWSIFDEFTDEQKKLFLKFTTGTDRCPHGGLSELKLIIARNGPDTEKLPTAHTCFNVLLLPEYESKQKLKEKLLKAIEYAHGFGLS